MSRTHIIIQSFIVGSAYASLERIQSYRQHNTYDPTATKWFALTVEHIQFDYRVSHIVTNNMSLEMTISNFHFVATSSKNQLETLE